MPSSEAIRSHKANQSESEAIQSAERAVDVERSDGALSGNQRPIRATQSQSERAVDVERADGALSGGQELAELHVAEHATSK
jgi:hypothetical protein